MKKEYKLINFCEFDSYAVKSYCAIHNVSEDLNLGDITKVDVSEIDDFNFMTFGFCCQDISLAGKQLGFIDENGDKTRSGLYYDAIEILREKKPKFTMIENVKNLVSKKFDKEFQMILDDLDKAGYNVYYKVLNASEFGTPQNRERIFIIGIRKDVDNKQFVFPKGFESTLRIRDVLDEEVDKKYYLSDSVQQRFQFTDDSFTKNIIGTTKPEFRTIGQRDLVYQVDGIMGTLVATDYKQPKQLFIQKTFNKPTSEMKLYEDYVIRKLTPMESFPLQAFTKEDCKKCMSVGISDTQLYKQIGNSISVNVLYYIYLELYKAMPYLFDDLKVSSFFSGIGAFEKALERLYTYINNEQENY